MFVNMCEMIASTSSIYLQLGMFSTYRQKPDLECLYHGHRGLLTAALASDLTILSDVLAATTETGTDSTGFFSGGHQPFIKSSDVQDSQAAERRTPPHQGRCRTRNQYFKYSLISQSQEPQGPDHHFIMCEKIERSRRRHIRAL